MSCKFNRNVALSFSKVGWQALTEKKKSHWINYVYSLVFYFSLCSMKCSSEKVKTSMTSDFSTIQVWTHFLPTLLVRLTCLIRKLWYFFDILFYFHESVSVVVLCRIFHNMFCLRFSSWDLRKNWECGTAELRVIAQQVLRQLRRARGTRRAKKQNKKKTQIICNISNIYWKGFSISTFLESCRHWSHIGAAAKQADTALRRSPEEKILQWVDLVLVKFFK